MSYIKVYTLSDGTLLVAKESDVILVPMTLENQGSFPGGRVARLREAADAVEHACKALVKKGGEYR